MGGDVRSASALARSLVSRAALSCVALKQAHGVGSREKGRRGGCSRTTVILPDICTAAGRKGKDAEF